MKKCYLLLALITGLQISSSSLRASSDKSTVVNLGNATQEVQNSITASLQKELTKKAHAVLVFLLKTHGDKTLKTVVWNGLVSSGLYAASWVPFSDDIFNGVKSKIPVIKDIDNKKLLMFIRSLPIMIYMLSYADQATKRKITLIIARLKTTMHASFKTQFKDPVFELISEFIQENPRVFEGFFKFTVNNTGTVIAHADNVNVAQINVQADKPMTPAAKAALKRQLESQEQRAPFIIPVQDEEDGEASGVDEERMKEIQGAVNAADADQKKETRITIESTDIHALDALDKRPARTRKQRKPSNQVVGQAGFLSMMRNFASTVGQKVSGLLTEDNSDDETNDDKTNDGDKK